MIPQSQCQKDFQEWIEEKHPDIAFGLLEESIDRDGTYHNPCTQRQYETWIAAYNLYNPKT